MRVKVVRTPGELRDEIGHKIMVQKDWQGTVVEELDDETRMFRAIPRVVCLCGRG